MTEQPKIIEAKVYDDNRGWFMESFNRDRLRDLGITNDWMQDNNSFSKAGVIRGIHYQLDGQAKLVRCVTGKIIDVVVDIRFDSQTLFKYRSFVLSEKNAQTLYVPPGFGHSFIALEDSQVLYKVDKPWNKELERGIRFDDPELAIPWTDWYDGECILSERDRQLPFFKDAHKVKGD